MDTVKQKRCAGRAKSFDEFDSHRRGDMIVLEGQAPLGDEAHRFYDELIYKLSQDG